MSALASYHSIVFAGRQKVVIAQPGTKRCIGFLRVTIQRAALIAIVRGEEDLESELST